MTTGRSGRNSPVSIATAPKATEIDRKNGVWRKSNHTFFSPRCSKAMRRSRALSTLTGPSARICQISNIPGAISRASTHHAASAPPRGTALERLQHNAASGAIGRMIV